MHFLGPTVASSFPRPQHRARPWPALLLLALCAAGCGGGGNASELETGYGARRGQGQAQSVSGTSVLGEMFSESGAKVSSWSRLSPKLEQADVIVWAPDSFAAPSDEVRSWLENWLRKRPSRTLVYIGRDFDAVSQYWKKVQPQASAEQAPEIARVLAQSQAEYHRQQTKMPAKPEYARWFVIDGKPAAREVHAVDGPWAEGVDGSKVEITLGQRLRYPQPADIPPEERLAQPDYEMLLGSKADAIAYRLTQPFWNDSQIIVVTNGSFLLNLPLVNHEHRKLAGRLVEECGPVKKVVFLETGDDDPEIHTYDAEEAGSFAMLRVWPLNVILLQAAILGMLYLASRFPIFGRARELPVEVTGDFGKHIDALAQHLARTGDAAFAQARLIHYQQTARRESGASHVKPQSAAQPPSPPTKPG